MGFSMRLPQDAWTYRDARAYRVQMPVDITVVAACEDVGCDQWRTGWNTVADESTAQGVMVANWIRSGQSGRTFRELIVVAGQPAVFRFDPGQRCFREHRWPGSNRKHRTRPGRLLVYSRGRGVREHSSLRFLAEDYTEHAGLLAAQQERG
jgi:hypothetical protein